MSPAFPRPMIFTGPVAAGQGAANPVQSAPRAEAPRPARRDSARAEQLVVLGNRLFRVGNLKRATDRFEQAARADVLATSPLVGLAQVALVKGDYAAAADRFREAEAADPGWLLVTNRDVQGLYAEPGDFAAHIAKLETHLQAQPDDRDAWLVLGAEWFLSGRVERAADVFLRLSDRKDATVAAFLAAVDSRSMAARDGEK